MSDFPLFHACVGVKRKGARQECNIVDRIWVAGWGKGSQVQRCSDATE